MVMQDGLVKYLTMLMLQKKVIKTLASEVSSASGDDVFFSCVARFVTFESYLIRIPT